MAGILLKVDYRFCLPISRNTEKNFVASADSGVCLPNTVRILTNNTVLCSRCQKLNDECAPVSLYPVGAGSLLVNLVGQPPAGMAGDGMDLMDLLHAAQIAWSPDDNDAFIAPAPVRLMLAVGSKQLVKAFNHVELEHRKNQHLACAKKDRVVSHPRPPGELPLTRWLGRPIDIRQSMRAASRCSAGCCAASRPERQRCPPSPLAVGDPAPAGRG